MRLYLSIISMEGRILFRLVKPILLIGELIFKYTPTVILKFLWSVILPFNGYISKALRYCILKAKGKGIGDNVYIGANVIIKYWNNFSCGSNVSIHEYCYIDCDGGVSIGNDVSIAHATSLVSANHTWNNYDLPIKYNELTKEGITIRNDVWIGCGVRILDGVVLNERTVVAAGAVVNKCFPEKSLIGGVPAKLIKSL